MKQLRHEGRMRAERVLAERLKRYPVYRAGMELSFVGFSHAVAAETGHIPSLPLYRAFGEIALLEESSVIVDIAMLEFGSHRPDNGLLSSFATIQQFEKLVFTNLLEIYRTFILNLIHEIYHNHPQFIPHKLKVKISNHKFTSARDPDFFAILDNFYRGVLTEADERIYQDIGFSIFSSPLNRLRIQQMSNMRNLIVHHGGSKTSSFLASGSKYDRRVLPRGKIKPPPILTTLLYILRSIIAIDQRASERFELSRALTEPWSFTM